MGWPGPDPEARLEQAIDRFSQPQTILQQVGGAAANLLLETVEDGDTICITGGKGLSAVVGALNHSGGPEARR